MRYVRIFLLHFQYVFQHRSKSFVWFLTSLSNLIDLLHDMTGTARYPREIFHGMVGYMLFFLLPITFIVNTPIKTLLQKASIIEGLMMIIFTIGFFILSRLFWKFALRFYTSASG